MLKAGKLLWAGTVVVVAAAGLVVWRCLPTEIRANEWSASDALRILAWQVEAEFRDSQPDGNGGHYYWTGDVATLADFHLIPEEVAAADAAPLLPRPGGPVPFHGYYFIAMRKDEEGLHFNQERDATGRKVYNRERAAFCAFPAVYGKTGRQTMIAETGDHAVFKTVDARTCITDWPPDKSRPLSFGRA